MRIDLLHSFPPVLQLIRFFAYREYVKGFTTDDNGSFRWWGGGLIPWPNGTPGNQLGVTALEQIREDSGVASFLLSDPDRNWWEVTSPLS